MNRIEQRHIEFLRLCASNSNKVQPLPADVPIMEADALVTEGLLIKYNKPNGPHYAIGRYGSQYVKETYSAPESPDMKKLAVDFVVSKGYEPEAAETIVENNGVEVILNSQAEELRKGTQREVTVPMNEQGLPQIKFKG